MYVIKLKIDGKIFYRARTKDNSIKFTDKIIEAKMFKVIDCANYECKKLKKIQDYQDAEVYHIKIKIT